MKALITGVDGFVGYYLTKHLLEKGDEVYGTTISPDYKNEAITVKTMDLLDQSNVEQVINEVNPDAIYHLAGQSAVGLSWDKPQLTMSINVNGTLNLLDVVKQNDEKHSKKTKVLIIGSSDQYGPVKPEECPIKEERPLNPVSPYGISKMTQEQMAKLYVKSYDMQIIMVRAFNHIGPRQNKNFVVADFASRIAEIEQGAEPIINVGNLEAYRDFTDVRDIVMGYRMLIEKGHIGEVYNIGSGQAIQVRKVLDKLVALSCKEIEVNIDASRLRPVDVPLVQCDNHKIKEHTGWQPVYDVELTLKDTLDYWRNRVE